MPWLSRNDFTASDKLHADDLNNLANDQRTWGGDVNGGGYTLSNVVLVNARTTSGAGVTSFNTRTGDVLPVAGDYTAAMVGAAPNSLRINTGPGLSGGGPLTGDLTLSAAMISFNSRVGAVVLTSADISSASGVLSTRRINTGTGLTGGGNLVADLTLAVVPDSVNQQVQVQKAGTLVGTRRAINLIEGSNTTLTVADNSGANRVDVTVTASGPTSGMSDPTKNLGDLIVRGLTLTSNLPVGTNGQVLTADSGQALGMRWATPASSGGNVTSVFGRTGAVVSALGDYNAAQVTNAIDATQAYVDPAWLTSLSWTKVVNAPVFMVDYLTTKGDIPVRSSATTTRLPVGADGLVLMADSSQPVGVKWAPAPTAAFPVTSVFGRIGAIAAATGDYTAAQITNAVDMGQTYADPSWLTSLSWSKITGAPAGGVSSVFGRTGPVTAQANDYTVAQITGAVAATRTISTSTGLSGGGNLGGNLTLAVVPDTTNQQVQVQSTGSIIGTRRAINFVSGANVSISVIDSAIDNRVNVTVSSTGGSGGMVDPTTTVGDLIVRGSSAVQKLPVGTNGQVLTADSTQALGVKWAGASSGSPQSPWASDIDAAGHALNSVGAIGVNRTSDSTTARIWSKASGTEEGVAAITSVADQYASISTVNDVADYLRIRSYSSGYATDAGTAAIEASNTLRLLANSAEVMRLTAGHVLIGTLTDDTVNTLQVAGTIKSSTGGFVFPDGSSQTSAAAAPPVTKVFGRTGNVAAQSGDYTAAQVTNAISSIASYADPAWITSLSWTKIQGAPAPPVSSVFGRTGVVVAVANDYTAAQVTNAVSTTGTYADPTWITSLAWSKISGVPATGVSSVFGRVGAVVAQSGDYSAAQVTNAVATTGSYGDPAWITSLAWSKLTGVPSTSTFQTPWVTDIDGNLKTLNNVGKININNASGLDTLVYDPASVQWYTSGNLRWNLTKDNPETGSNAGSNLCFYRYADDGSYLDLAVNINRSNGQVSVYKDLYVAGAMMGNAYLSAPSVYATGSFSAGAQNSDFVACTNLTLAWYSPVGKLRWQLQKSGTESGSDAGSDLFINRCNDAGGMIDSPITIFRASGVVQIPNGLRVTGGTFGIGTANPGWNAHLVGAGQLTLGSFDTVSGAKGGTLYLQDSGGAAYNGGCLLFGAAQGSFACIKGALTDNNSNSAGVLSFMVRTLSANSTLTEVIRISTNANVNIVGSLTVNGAAIAGGISTCVNLGSLGNGTVYQNNYGKPLFIQVTGQANVNGAQLILYCDTSATPTTPMSVVSNPSSTTVMTATLTVWVMPGWYYKVSGFGVGQGWGWY